MCGRYVLGNAQGFSERFRLQRPLEGFLPHFNAVPTQALPVILADGGERQAELMRWGLVFPWAKDKPGAPQPFNARAETLAEKPAFRRLVARQRCLVAANGFYEWQKVGGAKRPLYFRVRDEPLFAFAGIYERATDEAGLEFGSYAVLTTRPNELLAQVHNRMPVILHPDDEEDWLDPDLTEPAALERFYAPFPAEAMVGWPVSPRVNNTRNEGPDLIAPAGEPINAGAEG